MFRVLKPNGPFTILQVQRFTDPEWVFVEWTADGTQRFSTSMVRVATSSTEAFLADFLPGIAILGFSTVPSSATRTFGSSSVSKSR